MSNQERGSTDLHAIRVARGRIYGDPRENHRGIAQAWAGLIQPHWRWIGEGKPLPEHTVAMMMATLKMNRMRRVYHQDNYDDLRVYLGFAEEWQKDWTPPPVIGPHRIYVAGPYSIGDKELNVKRAVETSASLMKMGHMVHCPHSATHPIDQTLAGDPAGGYEEWMRLDFTYIRYWATALFRVPGESKGADREVELAADLGLPVWRSLEEVPPPVKRGLDDFPLV